LGNCSPASTTVADIIYTYSKQNEQEDEKKRHWDREIAKIDKQAKRKTLVY